MNAECQSVLCQSERDGRPAWRPAGNADSAAAPCARPGRAPAPDGFYFEGFEVLALTQV
jgi:hypothetical protein